MINTIAVHGYRSLRDLRVPLSRITVITGANGAGKSSLYRALRLLADCAEGQVVASLAREGGLPSTLWAGPEVVGVAVRRGDHPVQGTVRADRVSLQLGFAADDFSYLIDLGLPIRGNSAFDLDPEIKRELVWMGEIVRPSTLLARRSGPHVELRDGAGWVVADTRPRTYESMITEVVDLARAPELFWVREQVRSWRFYDQFRTDANAPARTSHVGTRTPVLNHDGRDLAAALQTILEIGNGRALRRTIADAFPGAELTIRTEAGRFELQFNAHGLLRPLGAAELSDGTLRYLLMVAALLSPRPPGLMVLNEPETSLHPDLLAPLARLIGQASRSTQIVVVSHAAPLITALQREPESTTVELVKDFGETQVAGQEGPLDGPPWSWGSR